MIYCSTQNQQCNEDLRVLSTVVTVESCEFPLSQDLMVFSYKEAVYCDTNAFSNNTVT